jgi:hypothetical protein
MPGLISVITVNLNDAAGLRATAQSVATQERPPDEWIVIDGGSRDGSLAVIREFEALIHSWISAPDRGVYDGMNRGLRRARGCYVLFMNAGDCFAGADSLARIAAALEASPGVDLLFGGTILALPSEHRLYRPPRAPAHLRFGPPAYHQATVFRPTICPCAFRPTTGRRDAHQPGREQYPDRPADRDPRLSSRQPVRTGDRVSFRRFREGSTPDPQPLGLGGVAAHLARLALIHCAYRALRKMGSRRAATAHGQAIST